MALLARRSAPARVSVWDQLGLSDAGAKEWGHTSPRTFSPGLIEAPGGERIVGLCYVTDFDATEEYGVADLRKALTSADPRRFQMTTDGSRHVTFFTDVNALMLSVSAANERYVSWGSPIDRWSNYTGYSERWASYLPCAQGMHSNPLWREKVTELRARAKALGVSPLPRKRVDLETAILSHPNFEIKPEHPEQFPAIFHSGCYLVLRAETGPTARILAALIKAAEEGFLAVGSGSGPFATGLFFYDSRDETAELVADREARFDWHDEQMELLAPVAAELKARGFGWYFLGKPSVLDTGDGRQVTRYWLNGQVGNGASRQPFGWYTLDELLAEKFVEDANTPRR